MTTARRNLTPDAFKNALGRRYNRTKKSHGGDRKSKPQNEDLISTAQKLAKEHGVSRATVKRAGKFAEEVEADPELPTFAQPFTEVCRKFGLPGPVCETLDRMTWTAYAGATFESGRPVLVARGRPNHGARVSACRAEWQYTRPNTFPHVPNLGDMQCKSTTG